MNFLLNILTFVLIVFSLHTKAEANPPKTETNPHAPQQTQSDDGLSWPDEYGTWEQEYSWELLNDSQVHALNETLENHFPIREEDQNSKVPGKKAHSYKFQKYHPEALIQALENKGMGDRIGDIEKHFIFYRVSEPYAIELGKRFEATLLGKVDTGEIIHITEPDLALMSKKERKNFIQERFYQKHPETNKLKNEKLRKKKEEQIYKQLIQEKIKKQELLEQKLVESSDLNIFLPMKPAYDRNPAFDFQPLIAINTINQRLSGLADCAGIQPLKRRIVPKTTDFLVKAYFPTKLYKLLERLDTDHLLSQETRMNINKHFNFKRIGAEEFQSLSEQLEQRIVQEITTRIDGVQKDNTLNEREKQFSLSLTQKQILLRLDPLIKTQKSKLMTDRKIEMEKKRYQRKKEKNPAQNAIPDQMADSSENR